MFEVAGPEIGEVVTGRNKLKSFAEDVGKKQFGNNWEVEKRNTSVELVEPDPFLGKRDKKLSLSRRQFRQNKISVNQGNFRYGLLQNLH